MYPPPPPSMKLCVSGLREKADIGTDEGFLVTPSRTIFKDICSYSSKGTSTTHTKNFFLQSLMSLSYFLLFLAFMDSNILKTNYSYLSHLGKFLEPAVGYNSQWLLCWRATLQGWDVSTQFHRRCDGKRDTVTIIKKGKYVFGGYTDIPWGKNIACSV